MNRRMSQVRVPILDACQRRTNKLLACHRCRISQQLTPIFCALGVVPDAADQLPVGRPTTAGS